MRAVAAQRFISYNMTRWIQNESLNHERYYSWKVKLLIKNMEYLHEDTLFHPILYIAFEI